MNSWQSPQKIHSLGHGIIKDIFDNEVIIEEKIDGSFFQFGIFNGQLKVRSKGLELDLENPEKMFKQAIDTVLLIKHKLIDGFTYRAEYLQKTKHNTLAYNRIPKQHLIIFDVLTGQEQYLNYEDKKAHVEALGLEVVPLLSSGLITAPNDLTGLLEHISILGGQKIEGFVIKNYSKFGSDDKAMFGKFVSEKFKEIHHGDWKDRNPTQNDIITRLVNNLKTPARIDKAIQHLKERGELTNTPKDIGGLIKEMQADILTECSDYIKEELFKWAINNQNILRQVTNEIPSYYKEKLLESSFKVDDNGSDQS